MSELIDRKELVTICPTIVNFNAELDVHLIKLNDLLKIADVKQYFKYNVCSDEEYINNKDYYDAIVKELKFKLIDRHYYASVDNQSIQIDLLKDW